MEESLTGFMDMAIEEAQKAAAKGEVPVGAIIVHDDDIIGRGHNLCEETGSPLMHAEIIAMGEALATVDRWQLGAATMFVTLEPCPMCAGALVLIGLKRLVFGAFDPKMGAAGTLYDIVEDERLNHRLEVVSGIRAAQCEQMLLTFFQKLRS